MGEPTGGAMANAAASRQRTVAINSRRSGYGADSPRAAASSTSDSWAPLATVNPFSSGGGAAIERRIIVTPSRLGTISGHKRPLEMPDGEDAGTFRPADDGREPANPGDDGREATDTGGPGTPLGFDGGLFMRTPQRTRT